MITRYMLHRMGACLGQWEKFTKEWPKGAKVNVKNVLRAKVLGLDLDWFASHYFTDAALTTYRKAQNLAEDIYNRDTQPAWNEYEKATRIMRETHGPVKDPGGEALEQAVDKQLKVYYQAASGFWDKQCHAIAEAFVAGYEQTEKERGE